MDGKTRVDTKPVKCLEGEIEMGTRIFLDRKKNRRELLFKKKTTPKMFHCGFFPFFFLVHAPKLLYVEMKMKTSNIW